jgi:hypothetical protein
LLVNNEKLLSALYTGSMAIRIAGDERVGNGRDIENLLLITRLCAWLHNYLKGVYL